MTSFDLQQACENLRGSSRLKTDFEATLVRADDFFSRSSTGPTGVDPAVRACGALLGVAAGDAPGRAVEGKRPPTSIERYEKWRGWSGGPVGTITDDTQMTMWLAERIRLSEALADLITDLEGDQVYRTRYNGEPDAAATIAPW